MKKLQILEKLMSFETRSHNHDEINKLFDFVESITPKHLHTTNYNFNNQRALLITNTPNQELDTAFITHIDVVPASSYKMIIENDKIKGRGSMDMKGSVATILELLFNFQGNQKIGLLMTSDEEIGGENGVLKIIDDLKIKFAIIPDGGRDFKLEIGRAHV